MATALVPAAVPPLAVVAMVPATLLLFLFCRDPRWPVAAFVVLSLLGFYRSAGMALGPVNLRLPDVPFVFIAGWALLLYHRTSGIGRRYVTCGYLGLFLGALGTSLLPVAIDHFGDSVDSLVGYVRFAQTVSLAWLLPPLLPRPEDRRWMMNLLTLVIVCELLYALYTFAFTSSYYRLAGHNGPNAEGLLAAVLIVIALHSPVPTRRDVRLFCLALGVICLPLAKSIGSIVALGVVLGVFGLTAAARRLDLRKTALVRPLRVLLLLSCVFVLVSTLRPDDLPGSRNFTVSSANYRLVVGYAGYLIWLDHPVLGVGWQRSSDPKIIAEENLVEQLREKFPNTSEAFFPTPEFGASVHNAYIQVLAETGLVGMSALLLLIVVSKRRVRTLLAGAAGSDRALATAATLGLLVVVVWWNDNPFFGSQPETVLATAFLGILGSYRSPGKPPAHGSEVEYLDSTHPPTSVVKISLAAAAGTPGPRGVRKAG